MLTDLLPFATFEWLGLGAITLSVLKVRSSSRLGGLGRAVFRQTADERTSQELAEALITPLGEEA